MSKPKASESTVGDPPSLQLREFDVEMINPSTETMYRAEQGGSKVVVIGRPGCFAAGTLVMTPGGGEVPVERLRAGDALVGDDFAVRTVLAAGCGVDRMYTIRLREGDREEAVVVVNTRHILSLLRGEDMVDIPIEEYLGLPEPERRALAWVRARPGVRPGAARTLETVPFSVTGPHGERVPYFGVTVDGNQRFLLADSSVVHNSGKTYAITSMLYHKRHVFPYGMVVSGTEEFNKYWCKHFPSTFIYNRLYPDIIERFIHRQTEAVAKLVNPWSVLLLDDCADESKIINGALMNKLMKNGRHWKMLFILALQYACDVRPVIRANIDYTFIFAENRIADRKRIFDNYAACFPDFATFCRVLDDVTNDHTALVIKNNSTSNKLEDNVFWFRAPAFPPDFKFGSPLYWEHHNQRSLEVRRVRELDPYPTADDADDAWTSPE